MPPPGQNMIEERDEGGEEEERPEWAVGPEESELDESGAGGDEAAVEDAAGARVRGRLRVRDHEEGEDQQRAALEAVERNRERLAEPGGARDDERQVDAQERHGDVRAGGPLHDEAAGAGQEKPPERRLPPLPRRDPGVSRREDRHDDSEIGGVEDVLAAPAQEELARDGCRRGEHGERRGVGSKEEAEREPRNQGALGLEGGKTENSGAGELRCQRRGEEKNHTGRRDVHVQARETVEEKQEERRDLVEPGIGGAPADRGRRGRSGRASAHASEGHRPEGVGSRRV